MKSKFDRVYHRIKAKLIMEQPSNSKSLVFILGPNVYVKSIVDNGDYRIETTSSPEEAQRFSRHDFEYIYDKLADMIDRSRQYGLQIRGPKIDRIHGIRALQLNEAGLVSEAMRPWTHYVIQAVNSFYYASRLDELPEEKDAKQTFVEDDGVDDADPNAAVKESNVKLTHDYTKAKRYFDRATCEDRCYKLYKIYNAPEPGHDYVNNSDALEFIPRKVKAANDRSWDFIDNEEGHWKDIFKEQEKKEQYVIYEPGVGWYAEGQEDDNGNLRWISSNSVDDAICFDDKASAEMVIADMKATMKKSGGVCYAVVRDLSSETSMVGDQQ